MRRYRTNIAGMICALAVWAVAGCQDSTGTDAPNEPSNRTETIDLNAPYGGYTTADELPAFGDPFLLENFSAGENLAFAAAGVDPSCPDTGRPRHFLMVTWGNLRADSLVDSSTDWTGSLCAANGTVCALRTIRFDLEDKLLPRSSRSCVEWVSHTQPSFDGVLVSLDRAPCDSPTARVDSLCGDPITVTFKTGPLAVSFTEDELRDLHKVIVVDDAGNAVAFNTFVLAPGECPHGFLAGQWKDVRNERYAGMFRGQWVSENGLHEGFLHGVYGENRRGAPVFFGKWISSDGTFRGLLQGSYGRRPDQRDGEGDGWFAGVWFNRSLLIAGELHGVWGGCGEKHDGGGFFRGAWNARCPR